MQPAGVGVRTGLGNGARIGRIVAGAADDPGVTSTACPGCGSAIHSGPPIRATSVGLRQR